jgi:hypothetical protein
VTMASTAISAMEARNRRQKPRGELTEVGSPLSFQSAEPIEAVNALVRLRVVLGQSTYSDGAGFPSEFEPLGSAG